MFDLTLFEEDDETPFFGVGDGSGGVTEADFSYDPAHPRPYLCEVRNWSATQVDFAAGSSTLGGLTVEVLDKRLDPGDQRTGILTSRLKDVIGKRCLLRRRTPDGEIVTAFNGIVQTHAMGGSPEGLVKITLQLRDIRERERRAPIFFSNLCVFGKDGKQGPLIDYGHRTGFALAHPMLEAVGPALSEDFGGINHFMRQAAPDANGIYWGVVASSAPDAVDLFNLQNLGWPELGVGGSQNFADLGTAGIYYYRDFYLRWRAAGSSDPWVYLRNMPRSEYKHAAAGPSLDLGSGAGAGPVSRFISAPTLYFGSLDEYDIPEDGQEIEFQVIARNVTADTPFFWDGGTFGDLLKEIYDGLHSETPPSVQYDPDTMAAFRASTPRCRFILREPVTDMRTWVEHNIYAPLGYAPGFDLEMRVAPVSWALPDNATAVPRIRAESMVPIASFEHGSDNVINTVEYTYIREHLDPLKQVQKTTGHLWWKKTNWIDDPADDRAPWQRIVETKVPTSFIDIASVNLWGPKKITYEPLTVRTIAGVEGQPDGGDTQDSLGSLLAAKIGTDVLRRFAKGAVKITVQVAASDPRVQGLKVGDWVRLDLLGMPSYSEGRRG